MRETNGSKIAEIVQAVSVEDNVNNGVAKARFAGEAKISVPMLEKLLSNKRASQNTQERIIEAARQRGLDLLLDEAFPLTKDQRKSKAS